MTVTATGSDRVDVDVHCAPSSIRDLAPYLDRYWLDYFDGALIDISPSVGGAYPAQAATTACPESRASGVYPPAHYSALRQQLLDRAPETITLLTCVTPFALSRNPYCEAALARAVNDWVAAEWLQQDPRLRGSITVSPMNPDAAVEEIERIGHDPRFVQVLLPVRGQDARWGNVRFRRLLAAAAEHDLVVGLHAWGRPGSAPTAIGTTSTYFEDYLTNSQMSAQAQVTSLIAEGAFDQLPSLQVALLECGFSWLPGLLWRFDKDWKAVWREVPWMSRKPSEYVREHVRFSTQPAHLPAQGPHVREVLDMIHAGELLMYASDYPHDHGDGITRLLDALDEDERCAVLGGNARRFYRLG